MSICDIIVCSSRVEGYSTAVTEALILKIPVITTDCPGMKELLGNDEYGLITENNTESLYKGLKMILSDKSIFKLYEEKVKERSGYFSIKKQIEQYDNLFNSEE